MKRAVLIFVDGLGIGDADPRVNPVHSGACPHLEKLLDDEAIPIDAGMGLPGLPQSATGTTAILTGVNTAALMGRHVEGFPGERLKQVIEEQSIYSKLDAEGLSWTFANAYILDDVSEIQKRRRLSVTTVAVLKAHGLIRDRRMLEDAKAVYQNITGEGLSERGFPGLEVTPAVAAERLASVAAEHNFTLFEYFQTDHAGHGGDLIRATKALHLLDEFLAELIPLLKTRGILFALTSDHGNVEDLSVHTHTLNPVPWIVIGRGAGLLRKKVKALHHITPALIEWFKRGRGRKVCKQGRVLG